MRVVKRSGSPNPWSDKNLTHDNLAVEVSQQEAREHTWKHRGTRLSTGSMVAAMESHSAARSRILRQESELRPRRRVFSNLRLHVMSSDSLKWTDEGGRGLSDTTLVWGEGYADSQAEGWLW